jgi:hypothetical protein
VSYAADVNGAYTQGVRVLGLNLVKKMIASWRRAGVNLPLMKNLDAKWIEINQKYWNNSGWIEVETSMASLVNHALVQVCGGKFIYIAGLN